MDAKKPYLIAVIIQLIYTGMFVVSKAAFDHGMNTYVFIFYRQAAASLLLLPLALILERITFSLNLYNVSLKFTSATVASATTNAMPVVTFCFALLLKMEVVKLRSSSGLAKLAGVSLCLAGVFVIAFYVGPALSPVNHHRTFAASHASSPTGGAASSSRTTWIKGTFLMVIANMAWSLWIVLQGRMLKECPNKMLLTVTQCVFSAVQSFVVAAVAERDFSKWSLRFDISLLAVLYNMKGPVFLAVWNPLCFIFTIFCSSFLLGEIVHLGSVLWGKSKEMKMAPCGKVNAMDDENDHPKPQEKEQSTSISVVEQV
ncbi:hypothetical protein HU200_053292 [Digitaria exilis]|uniref:WAT1-related protein n=1 Tax=Digitaria exilis TaxID=1010633 RepID=A0A835AHT3_9POAL|nr:hypothetical protein HU200_053292 [Digitaria exilis]